MISLPPEVFVDGLWRAVSVMLVCLLSLPVVAVLERLRAASGPAPIGPRGWRTAVATAIKLLEKHTPARVTQDTLLSRVAPVLALVPTVGAFSVVPAHAQDGLETTVPFVLALPVLASGAVLLAGYGAEAPLAALSALRLVILRMATLVVLGIASVAACRGHGSVVLRDVIDGQNAISVSVLRLGALLSPPAACAALLAIAVLSQQTLRQRTEANLEEPWFGAVTGPLLLGHRIFESLDLLLLCVLITALFFGGYGFFGLSLAPALGVVVFAGKSLLVVVACVLLRNALPRLSNLRALRVVWLLCVPLAVLGVVFAEVVTIPAANPPLQSVQRDATVPWRG